MEADGIPNLFWVSPDLYRSAQPDKTGMISAKMMGIKSVVSLRESDSDPRLSRGTGLALKSVPMEAWDIEGEELLAALRAIHESPKPVLLHCRHGSDRTGLVVAAYRVVFQGWSKEDAKNEMINGGYGFHKVWKNIPKMVDRLDAEALKAQLPGLQAADWPGD
jgi:protein tyrosine phosphatase (PTP) superfamily phosphohydrolase (DUF442 family)